MFIASKQQTSDSMYSHKKMTSDEEETLKTFATPNALKGMPIKATFLDEISWDIPHQNWGTKEWDKDFKAMKKWELIL